MAEMLKNHLDHKFVQNLAHQIQAQAPQFDKKSFLQRILDKDWESLELKQRIRKISQDLFKALPGTYENKIEILKRTIPHISGLGKLIFPDFVEVHGMNHWQSSVHALKYFTPFMSSEFAIRPYIAKDPKKMMALLLKWSKDKDEHVRRLSSEGCRPRLPWSFKLKMFIEDPTDILKILENLKDDASLYVRKSVANNLNDVAKDHPNLVIALAKKWYGKSQNTNWILKHGLRTLLKRGDQTALKIFGVGSVKNVSVPEITFVKSTFKIGEHVEFNFDLIHSHKTPQMLRLEYAIHYRKKNGSFSKKIFKIKEMEFAKGTHPICRKHSLKQMTTRIHYPGQHRLDIIINGQTKASQTFIIK